MYESVMEGPPDRFDEVHEVEEVKRIRISLHLIAKGHLPSESNKWPQEKIVNELNKISHVRLDREKISIIDSFELLGPSVTNLYLQHNLISEIDGLECLTNLQFLVLSSNRIQHIQGLAHLNKLTFLELSENKIHQFDIDELPQSLIILSLKDNPCTQLPDYRGRIVQDLPKLRQLDGEEVTRVERQEAGYVVSDEEDDQGDDDDEDNEGLGKDPAAVRNMNLGKNASRLRSSRDLIMDIHDSFQSTTADILLRSQSRLEDGLNDHKRRMVELSEIRADNKMEPGSLSQRGVTPVSNKPTTLNRMKGSSGQRSPEGPDIVSPRTAGRYTK